MNSLPPPSKNPYWMDYRIQTPTFRLTPVEKPDMSPFLFHMTGKKEILSILEGDPKKVNFGLLHALIPENEPNKQYDAKVACFTESPIFSLDFFRYRSFRRWQNDQRFGIGFDKEELVKLGVRPCVYLDANLLSHIFKIKKLIENTTKNSELENSTNELISSIYPLMTPLLETEQNQGFMWEREWRYSPTQEENGLNFSFDLIRVICCPKEEEGEIKNKLGKLSSKISFVRSWIEYDEVVGYLASREEEFTIISTNAPLDISDYIKDLENAKSILQNTKNTLLSYQENITNLKNRENTIQQNLQEIDSKMAEFEKLIAKAKIQKQ
jgi:hypothetical protein